MGIFHDWTGNYGLAIILLTLVVKLILTPVNHKNMLSMRAMQKLQPKLEEIKKRYANDQEAQTREMMKLYQEEHFNPLMTGCLPMLLQTPIYVALYRAIGSAVELYQQPFLWISDLSLKEPIPFLAIALGLMTFLQQKFMSPSNNSQQNQQMKVMMYTMPVFLTLIMFALPSALVLYTLVNSILSILHQLYINKTYKAS
jgi:YidC/Oxa1 family membrane protein insertase